MTQKQSTPTVQHRNITANHKLAMATFDAGPDGALFSGNPEDEGKITVVYDRGNAPPVISIGNAGSAVQTILANGVAVAVVARADGPCLTENDVFLVERFVPGNGQ